MPSAMRGPTTLVILDAIATQLQLLEDIAFDYALSANVDAARDRLLERFGALVDEARGLLSDAEYRRIIRTKIAALRLPSNPATLLELVGSLIDASAYYYTEGHGFYQLAYDSTSTLASAAFRRRALRLLNLARPAGVETEVVAGTGNLFRLDRTNLDGPQLGVIL